MKNKPERCWICYEALTGGESLYHEACCASVFKSKSPPILPYKMEDLNVLAGDIVRSHITVPGVQPKLSLHIERAPSGKDMRLTLVGLEGGYILKPPVAAYPEMPELEHLTLRLAGLFGIETEACALIALHGGEKAFIARRMDRNGSQKLHMEDLCQLSGKLTEQKYKGSMEQAGKVLAQVSSSSGLDAVRFYELTLFCFLTGNADMHLKNFSILYRENGLLGLSPAYDLLATSLLMPEDKEEMALTVNGKKRKLTAGHFRVLAKSLSLTEKQVENVHDRFRGAHEQVEPLITRSFISPELQSQYLVLFRERWQRLGLCKL